MTLSTDDYIAIQQLYAKYTVCIDLGDVDGWLTTFTDHSFLPLAASRHTSSPVPPNA